MTDSIAMFPFEYVLDHEALEIHCGSMRLRRIEYSEIKGFTEGFSLVASNWCNLMPFHFITIELKSGWLRKLVINPPEATEFLMELSQRQKNQLNIQERRRAIA